jgi:hypothetical protein
VAEINTEHVLAVLKPLWVTKPETATQVRGRIEQVLDYARVLGHCEGENPADGAAISTICCPLVRGWRR